MPEPIETLCLGCDEPGSTLAFKPVKKQRRPLGQGDVLIDMKYCGVCHTDCVAARGAFKFMQGSNYAHGPFVPGHELAGVCAAVGPGVTKFKIGDHVGVGCMVDSCLDCAACKRGEEQMCTKQVGTYGAKDVNGRAATYPVGQSTVGGYTTKMVVHERFGVLLPKDYPLEMAGPVMCAGVTMYGARHIYHPGRTCRPRRTCHSRRIPSRLTSHSGAGATVADPLKRHGAKAGTRVGIIGVGGLGLTGVKIAMLMGCTVTAISRSAKGSTKAKGGLEAGADATLCSQDPVAMKAAATSFDLVLNTIPTKHDYTVYEPLIARGGRQILLGVQPAWFAALIGGMTGLLKRNTTIGSGIGGIQNTQEVVELFAKHKVYPAVQVRPAADINFIMEQLERGNEASLRYVLDLSTLTEANREAIESKPPTELEKFTILSWPAILKSLVFQKLFGKRTVALFG